jgi:hypothetical protein
MSHALDRYITGNYGEDQFKGELPEDLYHEGCGGEGCEGCEFTGIDQVKHAEYLEQQKKDDEAVYAAYLEQEKEVGC